MSNRAFKYNVQLQMEKDGWIVFPICDSDIPVDLLCLRKGNTLGLRVIAHGHIRLLERDNLRRFGEKANIAISYVHLNSARELVFVTLKAR